MLEGLSPAHLILILAIALIVVGPGKLPETGAALGRAIRGFRDAASGKDETAGAGPVPDAPAADAAPQTADPQEPPTVDPQEPPTAGRAG
ncbi:MAG TPA: twin-arginine translocase TatA/TatE family subunit [Candidatus Limnocylindrales bacterium]|nr:twin-arginine translocase TatA/TatE family subunit [Candidatus Limnocylindrales bacterium]